MSLESWIGAALALAVCAYLIYSLLRPEAF